jgi:hypothetical protein
MWSPFDSYSVGAHANAPGAPGMKCAARSSALRSSRIHGAPSVIESAHASSIHAWPPWSIVSVMLTRSVAPGVMRGTETDAPS